jgi:hypothetical protein
MAILGSIAVTAVDLFLSTQAYDSVAVLDGFTQIFEAARPMRATVRQPSRLLDHPIETGQVITDYSINLPVEIDLTVIVQAQDYRSTYAEIYQYFQTKGLLTVQLKTANYANMVIADIPHEETTQLYDAFQMVIKFRQILVNQAATSSNFSPADPTQSNTQALGQQNSYAPTSTQTTLGTQTSPGTAYSSVYPPTATANQVQQGPQTVGIPQIDNVPTGSIQTLTSEQSLSTSFGGGGS